jgi:hypothetical protein
MHPDQVETGSQDEVMPLSALTQRMKAEDAPLGVVVFRAYEGLEAPLWYQYRAFVTDDLRWKRLDLGSNLWAENLLPGKEGLFEGELTYEILNATSTPVGLEYHGNRILFASDRSTIPLPCCGESLPGKSR